MSKNREARPRSHAQTSSIEFSLTMPSRFLLELGQPHEQARHIAGPNRMLRHLLPGAWRQRCDQPGRSAEFQRHKNCGKICLDSGRRIGSVSCNLHGRLQSGWFSKPHSAERAGRYPDAHGIFHAHFSAAWKCSHAKGEQVRLSRCHVGQAAWQVDGANSPRPPECPPGLPR